MRVMAVILSAIVIAQALSCQASVNDEARKIAAERTGLDLDSGPPLYAEAKSQAFVFGSLDGLMVPCGTNLLEDTGFAKMVKHFSGDELKNLFKIRNAAMDWAFEKVARSHPSKDQCFHTLSSHKKENEKLLNEF